MLIALPYWGKGDEGSGGFGGVGEGGEPTEQKEWKKNLLDFQKIFLEFLEFPHANPFGTTTFVFLCHFLHSDNNLITLTSASAFSWRKSERVFRSDSTR